MFNTNDFGTLFSFASFMSMETIVLLLSSILIVSLNRYSTDWPTRSSETIQVKRENAALQCTTVNSVSSFGVYTTSLWVIFEVQIRIWLIPSFWKKEKNRIANLPSVMSAFNGILKSHLWWDHRLTEELENGSRWSMIFVCLGLLFRPKQLWDTVDYIFFTRGIIPRSRRRRSWFRR